MRTSGRRTDRGRGGFPLGKTRGRTLILLYHRVGPDDVDLHGLRVRSDRFAAQMEVLRRRSEVIPLGEILERCSHDRVAVTFDDGYADNLHEAKPILESLGIPATVFVTAGLVGDNRLFWIDRLAQLVTNEQARSRAIEVDIGGATVWADISTVAARRRAYLAMHRRLRPLSLDAIEAVLDDVESQLGAAPRGTARALSLGELRELAAGDLVEIGAHTLTHPLLAQLDTEQQWAEISGSRRRLQTMCATRVSTFAYPYGRDDAYNRDSVRLVDEAGFSLAFTAMNRGSVRRANRHELPRRVVGDWDGDEFGRHLDEWLAA